ncbi:MAG: response regulator transcription factor [Bacilli bacterium]|nr:response regulator transcription factor [Acholeplasmataceae bacterium]MDY2902102.1 response regulator transcription factor [Bacilli bacterium]
MKILVIEDDKHLNKAICEMLNNIAETSSIYDGEQAMYAAEQNIYDLIILDVMLPNVDGFTILKKIRQTSNVPVIMLTAKDSIQDKVNGLKLGADDYMTKPFYRNELIARVNALLRRYNNNFMDMKIVFKDMVFDLSQKTVSINGEKLEISGKSYDILEYLVRNKEMIITKEQLFNRIWGFESETIWSVVEVYVSNLRKLLKKYNYHAYLKTLRNVGYMWSEKE